MMYVPEKGVVNFVTGMGINVVKNTCPVDGSTKREYAKKLMEQINRENPGAKERLMTAILNGNFKDWPEKPIKTDENLKGLKDNHRVKF